MNLDTLKLLYLSLGPGVALAIYLYYSDKWDPEPKLLVIRSFLLGGLAVFPSGYIEKLAQVAVDIDMQAIPFGWTKVLYIFFAVALVEETAKFLIFKEFIYEDRDFNEPFDGVVYGGIIGAGFASMENLVYVLSYGTEVGVFRMLTAVPGHTFSGVILGYFVGTAKFSDTPYREFSKGLLWVIFLHGVYNTLAASGMVGSLYLFFGIGAAGIYFGLKAKRHLQRHSKILEFCDKKYCVLKNGLESEPVHLKDIRNRLASGEMEPEDPVCDPLSGRRLSAKKAIYREISRKRRELSRIPPMAHPLTEMLLFYFLTYGFFLFFWFYRTYREIRSFKSLPLNPELRTLLFFIVSTLPLIAYTQLTEQTGNAPTFPFWEILLAGTSGLEAAFIFFLVRLTLKTIHSRQHSSIAWLCSLTFFILATFRKMVALEWMGNWQFEFVLIMLQGLMLLWVQQALNRYWAEQASSLDLSKIHC